MMQVLNASVLTASAGLSETAEVLGIRKQQVCEIFMLSL